MKKKEVKFPKGWNAKSIKQLAEHYENQDQNEAAAEDEAAYGSTRLTIMAVPVELVPEVQKLIAKKAS